MLDAMTTNRTTNRTTGHLRRAEALTWRLAGVALLLVCMVSVALAACGEVAGGTPPPQSCGTVHLRGGATLDIGDAGQAESCFFEAFQQCRSVSLAVDEMSVDSGVDRTFSTQPGSGGTCIISDSVHSYVIPTRHDSMTTYTCMGLSRKDGGLLFSSCGADGDISVPAPASTPTTRPSAG